MKRNYFVATVLLLFVFTANSLQAQNNFFTNQSEETFAASNQKRVIVPEKYKTIQLDLNAMKNFLATLPSQENIGDRNLTPVIELPMPNGTTAKFHVWERSILEPGLAAQFPEFGTYVGQGITNKADVVVMDFTDAFHAMVLSSNTGSIFIDAYDLSTNTNYISYFLKDLQPKYRFHEGSPIANPNTTSGNVLGKFPVSQCIGTNLRTYRLALSCTHQYAVAATGKTSPTKTQTLAKIVTSINRVNAVYELELGIHFNLIANENSIIYVNTTTDPYTGNDDGTILINESQSNITSVIGSANFDIGHTFSTGGGGLANLGCVCDAASKAGGITGSTQPTGDGYDIDYVVHEMGHQCGANHTFNSALGFCGGNGSSTCNAEPGSGTTIMAYAGICDADNIGSIHPNPGASPGPQGWSDPQFHAGSLAEIYKYMRTGTGNTCAVTTNNGNIIPVAIANPDAITAIIPISTPFILKGSGSDANGDTVTYSWEGMDVGAAYGVWNVSPQGVKTPLFRSFAPKPTGVRYFPQLDDVTSGSVTPGEMLPTVTRTITMRLTVRDNRAGGGGTCFDNMSISVKSNGGAFITTFPVGGELWYEGQNKTITWNKGSTNIAPFNVANVAVELSIDGGYSFDKILLASTPNSGSAIIDVPYGYVTTNARIRVRALGNIFYNMTPGDFEIAVNPVPVKWLNFTAIKEKNNTVLLNWNVNEIDNHFYSVERSLDGDNFSEIGTVAASTASGNNHSYSFVDAHPFASKNYYRIKQVDKNGGYSYSNIIAVTIDEATTNWVVYPNPTTEKVNLFCNANYNNMQVQIFDAVGKLVYSQAKPKALKGEVITVSLGNLAKGVYSIKLQASNAETTSKKIIVQ